MKFNCDIFRDLFDRYVLEPTDKFLKRRDQRKRDKLKREAEWHLWFAWRPIRVKDRDCRWLEYVDRYIYCYTDFYSGKLCPSRPQYKPRGTFTKQDTVPKSKVE